MSEAKALNRVRLLTKKAEPKQAPQNYQSASSYYSEAEGSDQEELIEQSRYEARLAANNLRLNLFNSTGDDPAFNNHLSLRSQQENGD